MRPALSPAWATHLAILEHEGAEVSAFGDHLVVSSPSSPDYHWGNFVLVTDGATVDDAARWVEVFVGAHPGADWVSIGLPRPPDDPGAWATLGLEIEREEVMTTTTVPASHPLPAGYVVRHLDGGDWLQQMERDLADNASSGEYEPVAHERFVRRQMEARRDLVRRGLATYVGAFAGEALVADLGIVVCDRLARFQSVGTDPGHRRRGLAAHLLGVAAVWAAERGCTAWVIVTEADNDAGRVYRRAGFEPGRAVAQAYRQP